MFRVIWRVRSDEIGALGAAALRTSVPAFSGASPFAGIEIGVVAEPVFRASPTTLRSTLEAFHADEADDPELDLAAYGHAFVSSRARATLLMERLRNDPRFEVVEIQPRWQRPLRPSTVPGPDGDVPRITRQAYLDPSPQGLGVVDVRHVPGARGQQVRIVDIEDGWNFAHEDLRSNTGGVIWGRNIDDDHGTAVLGIYGGDSDGRGIEGIAPDALSMAASANWSGQKWNAAEAIRVSADRLRAGGVVLLEMHAPGPRYAYANREDQLGFLPVEFWSPERAAIRTAVQFGVTVVEAGGNGGEWLDDPLYRRTFDRRQSDTGAILVGAGGTGFGSTPARAKMPFSNYGSRIDVHAWGEFIVTTGGRSKPWYFDLSGPVEPNRCYTGSFGGTSGASPMIVGCVAAMQGARMASGKPPLPPLAVRDLLVRTGVPPMEPAAWIGPFPNLPEAVRLALSS